MSIFSNFGQVEDNIEADFSAWWNTHAKPFLQDDVEPVLKQFFQLFNSTFGKQALTAALAAVPEVATAGFGPTAISLATTLYNDAKTDIEAEGALTATQVLNTIQSALQIAKATSPTVTPADAAAAATIAA